MWSLKVVISFRVRVNINANDDDWEMVRDDGLMMNIDGDGNIVGLREDVHREALRGGGWCLEWLHPPPKGVQRKGREREREMTRERDNYFPSFHSFPIRG